MTSERNEELRRQIVRLSDVMAALRNPDGGCPWDLEQDFASIAPYTIEEAYEVADAISRGNMEELRGELGDLLLQTVYHARMAEEQGAFDLADVIGQIADKMIARHPHVFGSDSIADADAQTENWERIKARERGTAAGTLDGIALALPALMRAQKLQRRAARVGFDWPNASGARDKIFEELSELETASNEDARAEEAGDLLFSVVNYLRHLNIDAEAALRAANDKFSRRFKRVEAKADIPLEDLTLSELETLWRQAKRER